MEGGESVPLGTISSMGNAGVEYMNRSLGGGMLPTSLGFWISGRRKEWATFYGMTSKTTPRHFWPSAQLKVVP
jgi:hypothetical protein